MKHVITKENIDSESFYNCTRLAMLTGYANPPAAIKELGLEISVEKDQFGQNILRLSNEE